MVTDKTIMQSDKEAHNRKTKLPVIVKCQRLDASALFSKAMDELYAKTVGGGKSKIDVNLMEVATLGNQSQNHHVADTVKQPLRHLSTKKHAMTAVVNTKLKFHVALPIRLSRNRMN